MTLHDAAELRLYQWLATHRSQFAVQQTRLNQDTYQLEDQEGQGQEKGLHQRKRKPLSVGHTIPHQYDYDQRYDHPGLSSQPLTRSMSSSQAVRKRRRDEDIIDDDEDVVTNKFGTATPFFDSANSASSLNISCTSSPPKQLLGMRLVEDAFV
ncbi:hypothetical protein HD806DRAFT_361859 [Xylariaceae sp. AK1471]|nr:hypothetical protein HD806DRAFT_361859 [Xylariaceae sp. AK1471]